MFSLYVYSSINLYQYMKVHSQYTVDSCCCHHDPLLPSPPPQAHLLPTQSAAGLMTLHPPGEDMLWSYLLQLTAALRCVHSAGLLLRPACLHPTKV